MDGFPGKMNILVGWLFSIYSVVILTNPNVFTIYMVALYASNASDYTIQPPTGKPVPSIKEHLPYNNCIVYYDKNYHWTWKIVQVSKINKQHN